MSLVSSRRYAASSIARYLFRDSWRGCAIALLLAVQSCASAFEPAAKVADVVDTGADPLPNILLIVLDDLGYAELGAYGGEIHTPNIDTLATEGVLFTDFYVSPTCSPTRSMLLSGADHHRVGLGTMAEIGEAVKSNRPGLPAAFADLYWLQEGQQGYEGFLRPDAYSVAELLIDAGYATYMVGKWHLGMESDKWPVARGFGRSFALLDGAASHFSDAWRSAAPKIQATYVEDDSVIELSEEFYSTVTYTDKMLSYLGDHLEHEKSPFFAYLAYSAVHDPLHILEEDRQKYRGEYDLGYGEIRNRRINRMIGKGLIADRELQLFEPANIPSWDELSKEQRANSALDMELFAAMLERTDIEIGRILNWLDASGEADNTLVIVMSDNGASPSDLIAYGFAADDFDLSRERAGQKGTFRSYGPGWAQAGSGPYAFFKTRTAEGGIRAPLIVSGAGVDRRGVENRVTHVTDVLPTILDVAGIRLDVDSQKIPPSGTSFYDALLGEDGAEPADRVLSWELFGSRAVRNSKWKAVLSAPPFGDGAWQLYDLASDPGEANDLANSHPKELAQMISEWQKYAAQNGVVYVSVETSHPDSDVPSQSEAN